MRFDSKTVLITGGATGIGRATAIRFASAGASVVLADINESSANETVATITATGGAATAICADVARYGDVSAAVDFALAHYGRLDVLFNNAGVLIHKPLLDHDPRDYDSVIAVNQKGVFHGILAAGRAMRDSRSGGCIINTASVFAVIATSGMIGYHAAKAAVCAMTRAAALELAPFGIRVVAVAPGAIDSALLEDAKASGLEREISRRHMRRRILTPDHVAAVVVFLASDEADGINGSVVFVDDGYAAFK